MDNKYGLILDGEIAIGEFVFITDEDASGCRKLLNLNLNCGYVDLPSGRTKNIRCLLVEKIPEQEVNDPSVKNISDPLSIRVIKDFGIGIIEGRCTVDYYKAYYQNARFIPNPKKLNSNLN